MTNNQAHVIAQAINANTTALNSILHVLIELLATQMDRETLKAVKDDLFKPARTSDDILVAASELADDLIK